MFPINGMMRGLCMAIGASLTVPCAASDVVAMLADVRGECEIETPDATRACAILDYLEPGHGVRALSGSITIVYLRSSLSYEFAAPARVRIEEDAPVAAAGQRASGARLGMGGASGLRPIERSGLAQAATVVRGFRRKVELLSPSNGKLLVRRPEFRWRAPADAKDYEFVLSDEQGREIYRTTTSEAELSLPDALTLEADAYYEWRVSARFPSEGSRSASADFETISDTERRELEALRPSSNAAVGDRVVFATVLHQRGFRSAARAEWQSLSAARPNDPNLRRLATQ